MDLTTGELPLRGDLWWVRADKRRPAVVIQSDGVREPRTRTFLVVPLTSRQHLSGLPGNVRLDRKVTRLSKVSVANVYDVQKIIVDDMLERLARLPAAEMELIDDGLRLVLGL